MIRIACAFLLLAAPAAAQEFRPLAVVDADGDGAVSAAEVRDLARARFLAMDHDGSGAVSPEEVEASFMAIFAAFDRNGDGMVRRPEIRAKSRALREALTAR